MTLQREAWAFSMPVPGAVADADGKIDQSEVQLFGDITWKRLCDEVYLGVEEIQQAVDEHGFLVDEDRPFSILLHVAATAYALGHEEAINGDNPNP